jgi:transcriptional regulator with PAS, ATPase and Fis domain
MFETPMSEGFEMILPMERLPAVIPTPILGETPAMKAMFALIDQVAPLRATVLVTGETGTGKELVARAIHAQSGRVRNRFIAVNCAAIPETLLESELFGHTRGSFTGAIGTKRGLFEEAHSGTLFLDEVDAIPESVQVKLLRVLQDRQVLRIGNLQPIPVDFRLIAATNVDLEAEVAAGRFREDLYYRLQVFPIRVPPLRERRSDIPLLAEYFLRRYAEQDGLPAPEIPARTMSRLYEYAWPGNVRELENYIERAVILHATTGTIDIELPHAETAREGTPLARAADQDWTLDRLEKEYILSVLDKVHGHQGHAADVLGIDRRTLYRKLKQYRLGNGVGVS